MDIQDLCDFCPYWAIIHENYILENQIYENLNLQPHRAQFPRMWYICRHQRGLWVAVHKYFILMATHLFSQLFPFTARDNHKNRSETEFKSKKMRGIKEAASGKYWYICYRNIKIGRLKASILSRKHSLTFQGDLHNNFLCNEVPCFI